MTNNSMFKSLFFLTANVSMLFGLPDAVWPQDAEMPIQVREAVAPVFPAVAIASAQEGRIPVDVTINTKGEVTSTVFGEGPSIFRAALRIVTARWRFAAAKERSGDRYVRLFFVFILVPSDTKSDQMLTVYRPPYEVEVKARFPVISKDAKVRIKRRRP